MATENKNFVTTLAAGEDLYADGYRYHAIALNDGKLAVNGEEASGILLNKPKSGEHLELGYGGEMPFAAGQAISAGEKLTVTTSGWFMKADSLDPGDIIVGECKVTVTSGSLGTGIFWFPNADYVPQGFTANIAAKDAIVAGHAVDLYTGAVAAAGYDADAVAQNTVSSGGTTNFLLMGVGAGKVGAPTSAGQNLTVTTSGYFTPSVGSGGMIVAKAISAIASGTTGNLMFYGQGGYKATSWTA